VSVANKGNYGSEARSNTAKHKKQIQSCHNIPNVREFFIKPNSESEQRQRAVERAVPFRAVKHHLSYRSMNCTSVLNQVICSDSEIYKKVTCERT
jgi:hypothetical protein